jgi:NitT/TauT family transport system substrate-binding protein
MRLSRPAFVASFSSLVAALAIAGRAAAADAVKVRVGVTNSLSDAPFFIGLEKGYFREHGVDVEFIPFDTAGRMIAPLGVGQLDVAGGAISPAFFNALERGVDLKIVANKASMPRGYGYNGILLKKSLWDSGKVKSMRDLKGMRVAAVSNASNVLEYALEKDGLTMKDVQVVVLGFPEHITALENGSVDAACTVEPFMSEAVKTGVAVRLVDGDRIVDNLTVATIFYGGPFAKSKPDAAKKFMVGYLQAVRYYNDALKGGRLAGPTADDVIAILLKYATLKDAAVYRTITPNAVDPDGRINMAGFKRDLVFFRNLGLVTGDVSVESAVDLSYVEAAVKTLGRYRPRR